VFEVLANLLAETDSVLALSGYRRLDEIGHDAIVGSGCVRP